MKKLFYSFLAVLIGAFSANATRDFSFILNIDDAAHVKTVTKGSLWSPSPVQFRTGVNEFTLAPGDGLYITPAEGFIAKLEKPDGSFEPINSYNKHYEIYNPSWTDPNFEDGVTYKFTAQDEASYRTKSVTITMDDPTKVKITRSGDGKEFLPTESPFELLYNPDDEKSLTITGAGYSQPLYAVTVDGEPVTLTNGSCHVELVGGTAEEPTYVSNIDVTANFPEGFAYKGHITLDAGTPEEAIKNVSVDGQYIENFLDPNGFDISVNGSYAVRISDEYIADYVKVNGTEAYISDNLVSGYGVQADQEIAVKAHKLQFYDATIKTEGEINGYYVSYDFERLELVQGDNPLRVKETVKEITVYKELPADYEVVSISDGTTEYTEDYNWSAYNYVTIGLVENAVITIKTAKIERNSQMALYIDDISQASNRKYAEFKKDYRNIDITVTDLVSGYNLINFRPGYDNFDLALYGPYEGGIFVYLNDTQVPLNYASAQLATINAMADGSVVKAFIATEPETHTVTFDVAADVSLDGYSVKKDILASVDIAAPVTIIGSTKFTIAPLAREATPAFSVAVDGEAVTADENGAFEFTVNKDATVQILAPAGIEDVAADKAAPRDVYNMQGILILRGASAGQIEALPAGAYIIGGEKVIKR